MACLGEPVVNPFGGRGLSLVLLPKFYRRKQKRGWVSTATPPSRFSEVLPAMEFEFVDGQKQTNSSNEGKDGGGGGNSAHAYEGLKTGLSWADLADSSDEDD